MLYKVTIYKRTRRKNKKESVFYLYTLEELTDLMTWCVYKKFLVKNIEAFAPNVLSGNE